MITKIRGAQITLADEVIAVTTDKLVFEDADGVFKKETVDDLVTALSGNGVKNVSSQLTVEPNDFAGTGLEDDGSDNMRLATQGNGIAGGAGSTLSVQAEANKGIAVGASGVSVDYDDATIGIVSNQLAVKANALDNNELNAGAGTVGYVLTLGSGGTLSWSAKSSVAEDYVQEAEIKVEHKLGSDVDSGDSITLASAPVANSVQVFLRGLLQEEGTGKDYILTGSVVTFITTPESADNIVIHYIAT